MPELVPATVVQSPENICMTLNHYPGHHDAEYVRTLKTGKLVLYIGPKP